MIDNVVISMDDNPLYSDFWEPNCKLWYMMGVKPILVKISNIDLIEEFEDKIIFNIKKIDGVNTGNQAQLSRLWVTQFYPNKKIILSDIDMLPLNKEYFFTNALRGNDDQIVSYYSNAYSSSSEVNHPICYLLAKGKLFKEILQLPENFKNFIDKIQNTCGITWTSDEGYITQCYERLISNGEKNKLCNLTRNSGPEGAYNRIARDSSDIDMNKVEYFKQNIDNYYDMHCPRPYKKYKEFIDSIVEAVENKYRKI